ncbi:MAG: hypothetical protein MJZ72_05430 [Bacteroidales bacterium]|nr:hypothetical protein [Bacteroidales bacterium]
MLDVELLVHGVPDGQDYYGIKEEQTNMGLFYDNSTESVKFIIETKKNGGKAYAYYTYLRYKGLIGAGGRSGSYFGLTLRVDKYYQGALHIYSLLDMLFNRYFVGALLAPSGDGYKYLVTKFAIKSAEIEKAQQALVQLVQTACVPTKFLDIDSTFIHPITAAPNGNIADVGDLAVLASIKKYSKVVLSPDYELNLEKDYKKKLQDAEGKGGSILADKDKIIAEKENTISTLNTTVNSQSTKISALEQEVKQLKKNGELTQLASNIKEPITALADYFRIKDSQPPKPEFGHKIFRLGLIGCALSMVILILCVVTLFKNPKGSSEAISQLNEQLAALVKENNQLKAEIAQLSENSTPSEPVSTVVHNLIIDIAGYSGSGPLSIDKTYPITIKEGTQQYSGGGSWKIENATIKSGKDTDAQITIQPNGNGSVTLNYVATNCTCEPRTIQITQASKPTSSPIIIMEPKVTEVEIDKEYTFSISGYDGEGTWGVDGFSAPNNKNDRTIKVKAIDTGKGATHATISYTPKGGSKVTKKFNIKKATE